jgi:hypothetical protein
MFSFISKGAVFIVLLAAFLFMGCSTESDNAGDLDGVWLSNYGDGFIIDLIDNTLAYDFGGGFIGYSGAIKEIIYFGGVKTAGVIFIEYTIKPVDYDTGTEPAGDFIGIYFRKLTGSTGEFASPVGTDGEGNYITPAKTSLEEAKTSFTEETAGDDVLYWVTYVKQ